MSDQHQTVSGEEPVPFERIASFMRQLAHDLHNDLNAIDLAATYISEITTNTEVREELGRQRETIKNMTRELRNVSVHLQALIPDPIDFSAADLIEGLHDRVSQAHPAGMSAISWVSEVGDARVSVDYEMFYSAMIEIFKNAFQFRDPEGKIAFHAASDADADTLRIELAVETPPTTAITGPLGSEPFALIGRRSYGLGLFFARRVAEAHGGLLKAGHDAGHGVFITEFFLPLKKS